MEPDFKNPPEPELAPEPERARDTETEPLSKSIFARIAGVALLLGAIAFGINSFTGGSLPASSAGPDILTPVQAETFTNQFQSAIPLSLPVISTFEHKNAIERLELSPLQEQQLKKDLAAGVITFVTAEFSDFIEVDGDAISINSTVFTGDVFIGHEGYTIALPVDVSNPSFSVTGISEGEGGGVTLRIVTSTGGVVPLPPLEVGQTVSIPLVLP